MSLGLYARAVYMTPPGPLEAAWIVASSLQCLTKRVVKTNPLRGHFRQGVSRGPFHKRGVWDTSETLTFAALREPCNKRILPAWYRFTVTSAPAGSSRRASRAWTPPPRNCSSDGPACPLRTSSATLASPVPPAPSSARAGTSSTAAWPAATPWWWSSTASAGAGPTPSGAQWTHYLETDEGSPEAFFGQVLTMFAALGGRPGVGVHQAAHQGGAGTGPEAGQDPGPTEKAQSGAAGGGPEDAERRRPPPAYRR